MVQNLKLLPIHYRFRRLVKFTFVDAIRGIVCVSYGIRSNFDSVVLWNSTIHKYMNRPNLLPLSSHLEKLAAADDYLEPEDLREFFVIGFGYDACTEDFKVVRIWIPNCSYFPPMFEVYSARQGLPSVAAEIADINLKSFQLSPSRSRLCEISCFVNRTIHWLLSSSYDDDRYDLVLMFDCEREEFKTMELPRQIYKRRPLMDENLLEYAGMLCVLLPEESLHLELWAMEEHGMASSWKKLCRISNRDELDLNWFTNFCPDHWTKTQDYRRALWCLSYRSFDESLFLMNHSDAQSYANDETVELLCLR